MKVSEISVADIATYLRINTDDLPDVKSELEKYLKVAKKYIKDETGLDDKEIDEHEDFIIVVYILCQDMYDHKTLYVDKSNINNTFETILGRHRINLL